MPINYKEWLYPLASKSIFLLLFICLFNLLGGLQIYCAKLFILNRIEQFVYIPTIKYSIVEFISGTLFCSLVSSILIAFLCNAIKLKNLLCVVLLSNLLLTIILVFRTKDAYQLLLMAMGFILFLTYVSMIIPSILIFKFYKIRNIKIISLNNIVISSLSLVVATVLIYFTFNKVLVAYLTYIHP